MNLREKLLADGYTKEEMDADVQEVYERQKKEVEANIMNKPTFYDTKFGRLITTDWIEVFVDKLINCSFQYQLKREREKNRQKHIEHIKCLKEKGFVGDSNSSYEVYKYEQSIESKPIKEIHNDDKSITYIYEDGLKCTITTTLSGVPTISQERLDKRKKQLLADALHIDEEKVLNMSFEEINVIIAEKEGYNTNNKPKLMIKRRKERR